MDPLLLLTEEKGDSDDEFFSLTETNLGTTSWKPDDEHTSRFYGKSSLLTLTTRAFDERGQIPPMDTNHTHAYREEFWTTPNVIQSYRLCYGCRLFCFQWLTTMLSPKPVLFEFPEMDLLRNLADCYFHNVNTIFPILHRPFFMRSMQQRLHETNQGFGAVVLLVCAIGCGFTDDPRVIQTISPDSPCTAWKFFHQANNAKKRHYLPHSLFEAQLYPVYSLAPPNRNSLTIIKANSVIP